MTRIHNVVDLDKVRVESDSQISAGNLSAPLVAVRDQMAEQQKKLLRQLFENADDALFELADKAGSNVEQANYFDAMRELRLQCKQILTLTIQAFSKSFNHSLASKVSASRDSSAAPTLESLSLLGNDELEERVAIETMVSKTKSLCGQSLEHYEIRVLSLLPDFVKGKAPVPGSPETLVKGFVDACDGLQVEITAKLVIFKLFDKYVLSESAKIYHQANKVLIAQGVIPDLRQVRQSPEPRQAKPPRPDSGPVHSAQTSTLVDGETGEVLSDEGGVFENLREMLNAKGLVRTDDVPPTRSTRNAMGVTEVGREQVVSVLSSVQQSGLMPKLDQDQCGVMDFRALLLEGMGNLGIEAPQLKRVEEDVLNLVSMLFEFILDDRQLQPTMKALIARLQIPILKVALLDRSFFNKGGHPARKLLNEIATAAIGWNEKPEGQRDPLREKVEYIVQRLLDDFTDDLTLFGELLGEFRRFLAIENRRGELIEKRTRDAEEGRARTETSKCYVRQTITQLIGDRVLPEPAQVLLEEGWGQYMSLSYLKHGEQSDEWKSALVVAEELIWSVIPDDQTPDARGKLLRLIPGLLKRLRNGLSEASFDPFKSNELLKSLEGMHVDALQTLAVQPLPSIANRAESCPESRLPQNEGGCQTSAFARTDVELPPSEAVAANAENKQAIIGEEKKAEEEKKASPESGTRAEQVAATQSTEQVAGLSANCAKMLESLRVGSWLELQEQGKTVRCKLAAIIRVTGKYIFVDRNGVKIAEKGKEMLTEMVQRGAINMLDDGLLFDRALESVIDNLRHSRRD